MLCVLLCPDVLLFRIDQPPSFPPEVILSFSVPLALGILPIHTTIILYLFLHKCVRVTLRFQVLTREKHR